MKPILALLATWAILILSGCVKKDWLSHPTDPTICPVDYVTEEYRWEIVYESWDYVILSGVQRMLRYLDDTDGCPEPEDKYGNCYREDRYQGHRVFNKKDCFTNTTTGIYERMIQEYSVLPPK